MRGSFEVSGCLAVAALSGFDDRGFVNRGFVDFGFVDFGFVTRGAVGLIDLRPFRIMLRSRDSGMTPV
jgi:hypothetical protein